MRYALLCAALAMMSQMGQIDEGWDEADEEQPSYSYGSIGTRHIDTLPKTEYPRAKDERLWSEPELGDDEFLLALHPKDTFRAGSESLERLCVVEVQGPVQHPGRLSLVLTDADGREAWRESITWVSFNPRMRPYWLPVCRGTLSLRLHGADGDAKVTCAADLADGAPQGLFEVEVPDEPLAVDEGYALLPAWESLVRQGETVRVRCALPLDSDGRLIVTGQAGGRQVLRDALTVADDKRALTWAIDSRAWSRGTHELSLRATLNGKVVATRTHEIHVVQGASPPERFGARYCSLRHTGPVYINYAETMPWNLVWRGKRKRDVVVDFPGRPYRFVLWRGCSYVACWAFPNTWVTYEWLEAEPDFYGAVGCVEPLHDKWCEHMDLRILSSTPARAVVHWRYALTDLHCKIIRDEWADEYFYLYPDAIGTRKLVGWIDPAAWHETQECIFINRPGNRPWQAVEPQAITFLSTAGHRARPVWPAPRFTVRDWPDYIVTVNVRGQPAPFMALPGEGAYVKVWAPPYVDKPGLFNSYLHWPISHGIRTTWVDSVEQYQRATHSNLVNVVNPAMEQADDHSVWQWLIGIAPRQSRLIEVAACWLRPGTVEVESGRVEFAHYDQSQRAYVLSASRSARHCRLRLLPEPGNPIINPAFVIKGWAGPAGARAEEAREIAVGWEDEGGTLVVWVRGRFAEAVTVDIGS